MPSNNPALHDGQGRRGLGAAAEYVPSGRLLARRCLEEVFVLMLVLIVAVAACLAVGLTLGEMLLVWCALGASVLGMLSLGYLLYTARRSSRARPATSAELPVEVPREPEAEDAAKTSGEPTAPTGPDPATPEPVEAGADRAELADPGRIVHVVPGRRRFHVDGCRLLAGKPAEKVSLDEAREEGFTACTSCIPDREALPTPR